MRFRRFRLPDDADGQGTDKQGQGTDKGVQATDKQGQSRIEPKPIFQVSLLGKTWGEPLTDDELKCLAEMQKEKLTREAEELFKKFLDKLTALSNL